MAWKRKKEYFLDSPITQIVATEIRAKTDYDKRKLLFFTLNEML